MVPTIVLLGGGVALGKRRLLQLRSAAEDANVRHLELAAEQAALRRVATAVASERSAGEIYALVSAEAADLLGAEASGVLRFDSAESLTVLGAQGPPDGTYPVGKAVPVLSGVPA